VHAIGRHPAKLALLARRGIETSLAGDGHPEPCDLVVEATGSAEGFRTAVGATRPRGTLVLKSTLAESPRVDLAPLVIQEIRVVGSRCGPFAPALRALADGAVDVEPLISARVPLSRADRALALAAAPGALKVLVEPDPR
jgi:threonine dehydrogenase-like Zn-dependent dehydrogenase